MYFIYHAVPEQMIGQKLIPLNLMKSVLPEVRNKNIQKYRSRKEILERKVPLLNCLWNDTVQFLSLHPQKVFNLQHKLGLIPDVPPYKFYEIALSSIDASQTVIFSKTAPGEENVEVSWLSEVDFGTLQEIPRATLAYYKTLVGTGELPFNYQFIPHVLFKGMVDISEQKIITLNDIK